MAERFSNWLIGWLMRNHIYQLLLASLQFSNCTISALYIGLLLIEHEKKQL